ncbi:unnamed protein product [Cuscuta campestris]|uniref:Uncharacterized protein n=1 Tax=Cuscuta campestris TaxID=132261 RepID=A0A484N986_9ASTE|nr:unnamed protein product [Cuscuta campestris]
MPGLGFRNEGCGKSDSKICIIHLSAHSLAEIDHRKPTSGDGRTDHCNLLVYSMVHQGVEAMEKTPRRHLHSHNFTDTITCRKVHINTA